MERRVSREFKRLCQTLAVNPLRGHPVKSTVYRNLRCHSAGKSLVFYEVTPDSVVIVRILDARQDVWTVMQVEPTA